VRRIAISLNEHAHAELAKRAQAATEPLARTAARYVRDGLLSNNAAHASAPVPATAPDVDEPAPRPPWIEPGPIGRERWRRETWSAVCALHARYTKQLARLPEDWWADRGLVERLAALCAWRASLDAGASDDPRAELLFHDRLEILQRELTAASRYDSRFTGGPPPAEWLAGQVAARARAHARSPGG
jgi:hypothetical protein